MRKPFSVVDHAVTTWTSVSAWWNLIKMTTHCYLLKSITAYLLCMILCKDQGQQNNADVLQFSERLSMCIDLYKIIRTPW